MNYAGTFIHTGTISGTFKLRWVHLNMSELGGGELCMLASLFQYRILNANDITIRN